MRVEGAAATAVAMAVVILATAAGAQHAGHGAHSHGAAPAPAAPASVARGMRVTMDELHANGGVPRGWRFTVPAGDTKTGREVFNRLECNKCHTVADGGPTLPRDPASAGPELTGMGSHHPAEYFAQSILDPNAVIVTGPGYTGADGLSIMPDYRDSLTAGELVDLVAYLKSLTSGGSHAGHHGAAPAGGEREQTIGDLKIRIAYMSAAAGGHGAHAGHMAASHLMVFVTDTTNGEPVPYLPITATVHAPNTQSRTLKLTPMVGAKGFHYGADVTLPKETSRIVLAIAPTTMRVMPSAAGRLSKRVSATFAWEPIQ